MGQYVGGADHRQRAGLVLAVERCWRQRPYRTRVARLGILGIVEPESEVEGVGGLQADFRVETENLIEQNGLDGHAGAVGPGRNVDVRLIPGEAEVAGLDS